MPRIKDKQALAKLKFARHRAQSKYRGIEFLFEFEEWNQWWLSHGVDKNEDTKWSGSYRPCMCRIGDIGPYSINNVYFANHIDNVVDAARNGMGNARGRKTEQKYQWGEEKVTLEQLQTLTPLGHTTHRGLFLADRYDANNQYETDKLINRWNNYVPVSEKVRKLWETPAGLFETRAEAAASIDMPLADYCYLVSRGEFQKHVIVLQTLEDYIRQNSRFPNPVIPTE